MEIMDDLISREGYKKVIDEQLRFYDPDLSPWHVKILELQRELLDSIPAVDAVPVVHARWVEKRWVTEYDWGVTNHRTIVCNACNVGIENGEKTCYCPNCGAKMNDEGM